MKMVSEKCFIVSCVVKCSKIGLGCAHPRKTLEYLYWLQDSLVEHVFAQMRSSKEALLSALPAGGIGTLLCFKLFDTKDK
eukprot:15330167-Ditylum_brightwellii.AAC.1